MSRTRRTLSPVAHRANLVAVLRTGNLTAPSMKALLVQVVDFIETPIEMEALTGTTRSRGRATFHTNNGAVTRNQGQWLLRRSSSHELVYSATYCSRSLKLRCCCPSVNPSTKKPRSVRYRRYRHATADPEV